MQAFQTHGGLNSFIARLHMEINYCRTEQPFEIVVPIAATTTTTQTLTSLTSTQTPNQTPIEEQLRTHSFIEDAPMGKLS